MGDVGKSVAVMRSNPNGVPFAVLEAVCRHYFGEPRRTGGSHLVFRTPWSGNPRVNIQRSGKMAKPYQVRQVLAAVARAEEGS